MDYDFPFRLDSVSAPDVFKTHPCRNLRGLLQLQVILYDKGILFAPDADIERPGFRNYVVLDSILYQQLQG